MRKILTVAALMGGMLVSGAALADNINENQSDTPGTTSTQVGDSMREPMVVSADNGNVREAPNAQAKILTTVPHGHGVTVIGTANGGAWAHVMVDGLDGYMDLVQLDKAPAYNAYGSDGYNYNNGYATYYSVPNQGVRYMAVSSDGAIVRLRPTVDSQVVGTLPRGSRVTVIGTSNGWAHIQGNGVDGYTDYVQLADLSSPPNTTYYTVYPSTSPTYYQPAPTYYQTTPTYQYQSPPTYYQSTPTYQYQSSPTYYQTTPTYQSTPTYYQSTPTYYQTTPTYQYQSTTTYYNPTTRVVNGYGGTIHQAPYSDSSLVTTLPPGTQVTVVGSVNGRWSHVVANGYDGYIDNGELQ